MNIYSFNEFTRELYINSLHPCDWLDNITPSIPFHSVVADAELPQLTDKQALIVIGKPSEHEFDIKDHKMTLRVFTVSENLEVVEDHRGEKYYSTFDGQEIEIKELGKLPGNLTNKPRPDQFHIFQNGEWVLDQSSKDQAEKQSKIDDLNAEMAKLRNDIIFGQAMGDDVSKEIARVKEIREELEKLQ